MASDSGKRKTMADNTTSRGLGKPYAVAAIVGIVVWWLIVLVDGVSEAWDADIYWSAAYPLHLIVCAILGWRFRHRAWSYGLVLALAQLVPMLIPPDELSLIPLALAVLILLAIPLMIVGGLSSWVAGKFTSRAT
jgi:hypothetical protein